MQLNTSQLVVNSLFESFSILKPLLPLLFAFFIIKILILIYERIRLERAGMFEIDKMNGDEFERFLAVLFEKYGYKATIVGSHYGDYGTDIVVERDGIRTAIQAKCWHFPVGIKAIQEVYGSLRFYNCSEAIVITNNYFTAPAKHLAKVNGVELWDRNALTSRILNMKN